MDVQQDDAKKPGKIEREMKLESRSVGNGGTARASRDLLCT